MRRVPFFDVFGAAMRYLTNLGVSHSQAKETVEVLLEAEARGYPTQGVCRLFEIGKFIKKGFLMLDVNKKVLYESTSVYSYVYNAALGIPAARDAVSKARELSRHHGVGIVGVTGTSHIGYLTHYAEQGAAADSFCLVTTVSSPTVVVPGTSSCFFGTNPLAYAFPFRDSVFCADFSTSAISRGEVLQAQENKVHLADGVLVDDKGKLTIDPFMLNEGGILPMGGGYKGMFLSFMLSLLAGPVLGGVANNAVKGTRWPDAYPNKTDFFLCINMDVLGSLEHFESELARMIHDIEKSSDSFHCPGIYSRVLLREAHEKGLLESPAINKLLNS